MLMQHHSQDKKLDLHMCKCMCKFEANSKIAHFDHICTHAHMQINWLKPDLHHVLDCKYCDATHCKFDAKMVLFFIFAGNANLWPILGE